MVDDDVENGDGVVMEAIIIIVMVMTVIMMNELNSLPLIQVNK